MDGDASLGQTRPDRAYPVQALPRSIDHLYIYNRAVGRIICVYESQLSWLEVIPVLLECIQVVPIIQIYPPSTHITMEFIAMKILTGLRNKSVVSICD